jgi:hypothetical protein
MLVCFEHTNNGGYWWLNGDDWAALASSGWEVSRDMNRAWLQTDSVESAVAAWSHTLPHLDPNDEGCECCSAPFRFEKEDEPGWWKDPVKW